MTPTLPRQVTGLRHRYFAAVRDQADADALAHSLTTTSGGQRRRLVMVLVVSAVSLVLIQLGKNGAEPGWLTSLLRGIGADGLAADAEEALLSSDNQRFNQLALWAAVQISGYIILPVLLVKLVLREKFSSYGVTVPRLRDSSIYAVAFIAFAPIVVLASFTQPFQDRYPFYNLFPGESIWPYLAAWWVLYALQFAALEWFFRGFMVHGLKPVVGYLAVPMMVVPYFLIHLQKPALEAAGAILAGMALGTLALKTRTIWWGAALHVTVAMTMDLSSLTQKGLLF
ncbi:MAG: CPBP family intramembrane metalloprotease [Acidimicrobiia bacterium]|nr:CPBP family intramembrane metalloprotease [Acidimicrobiia bacterium]